MIITYEVRARLFATAAHSAIGQTRKYNGEPYYNHCSRVAGMIRDIHGPDSNVTAAAWLHDVLEDTYITEDLLLKEFNERVVDLVKQVTNPPRHRHNLVRKEYQKVLIRHLEKADAQAQSIKLADIIDNTTDIVTKDINFAKVYIPERQDILEVLTKGFPSLRHEACERVKEASMLLAENRRHRRTHK